MQSLMIARAELALAGQGFPAPADRKKGEAERQNYRKSLIVQARLAATEGT